MTMATTTKTAVQVPCKDMALKAMEMDKRAEPATVVIPVCKQQVSVFNVCSRVGRDHQGTHKASKLPHKSTDRVFRERRNQHQRYCKCEGTDALIVPRHMLRLWIFNGQLPPSLST